VPEPRQTLAHFGPLRGGVRVLLDPWADRIVVQWYEGQRRRVKWWAKSKKGRASAIAWAEAFANGRIKGQQSLRLTLRHVWERYKRAMFKTLRPRTRELYEEHWTRWERFCGRHFVAEDAGFEMVDRFRDSMARLGLAPGHQQRIMRDVKTVYVWADSREIISRNRLASYRFSVAKEARRAKPAAYTRSEAERIIAQFDPQKAEYWRPWAVLVFAAYQARRQRSILHLRWDDVDWQRGRVRWVAKFDKNGEEQWQQLTLAGYCALLTAWHWRTIDGRVTPWVFYSPWATKKAGREEPGVYGAQALWLALTKAEERAGVTHRPYRAAHSLRRGAGKDVAALMGDPMAGLDWLGDRDPKQIATYVQVREEDYAAVTNALDGMWSQTVSKPSLRKGNGQKTQHRRAPEAGLEPATRRHTPRHPLPVRHDAKTTSMARAPFHKPRWAKKSRGKRQSPVSRK
jgi:hypothetical protein